MKRNCKTILLLVVLGTLTPLQKALAQCTDPENCQQRVPRVVKFNGVLRDADGAPRKGIVGVLFAIYRDSTGGAALWQETQNVQLDNQGRYEVLLGASTSGGVPMEIFKSGEPRWLGAQAMLPGETEQQRVLLVSVPYALVSGDAETLGGLPPSAFVQLAPGVAGMQVPAGSPRSVKPGVKSAAAGGPVEAADTAVTTSGGTVDTIPKFSASSSLVDSSIKEVNGEVTLQNLANILFADQFSDGVPGAVAACPSEGCTIYAGSKNINRDLGTINPGGKLITIYLGPYTYTVKQITLRNGLKIIGASSSIPGTILQSTNGNNPVFVIPQIAHVAATSVELSNLRIIGAVGNTSEDAFFLDASNIIETGLWYSVFHNLYIYNFAGIGIHLRGPNSNFAAANQWITFDNVVVFRTPNGGNALRVEGANFQLHFTDCEFDGQGPGDGENIFIGALPGDVYAFPFDITFRGLVSQTAGVGIHLDGAQTVTFHTSHHEQLFGAYLITANNGIGNHGVTITDSVFNPNVGVNNGAGYLLKVDTSAAHGIYFTHNRLGGVPGPGLTAPDSVVTAVNGAQVVYQDNQYYGSLNSPPTSGITTTLNAAATINIGGAHTLGINPTDTAITTIQSSLGPGETVTFISLGGPISFATGGNIALLGSTTLSITGTITFVRTDVPGSANQWWPVSQWTATSDGGTSGSFGMSGDASATVAAGETATYNLALTSVGGLSGPLQFRCVGAPRASSCSVSPSPLILASGTTSTSAVMVTTTARTIQTASGHSPDQRSPAGLALCLVCGFAAVPANGGSSKLRRWLSLAGLAILALTYVGCGTGGQPPPVIVGTPQGSYKLEVTGKFENISRSITLTLNVT